MPFKALEGLFTLLCPLEHLSPFKTLKNGEDLSVAFEIKQLSTTIRLVKLWTSFRFWEDLISIRAQIFLGLSSIPLWLSIYPRNFLDATPNAHLRGLGLILYLRRIWKVLLRCITWSSAFKLLMSMSFT